MTALIVIAQFVNVYEKSKNATCARYSDEFGGGTRFVDNPWSAAKSINFTHRDSEWLTGNYRLSSAGNAAKVWGQEVAGSSPIHES